MMLHNMNNNQV